MGGVDSNLADNMSMGASILSFHEMFFLVEGAGNCQIYTYIYIHLYDIYVYTYIHTYSHVHTYTYECAYMEVQIQSLPHKSCK